METLEYQDQLNQQQQQHFDVPKEAKPTKVMISANAESVIMAVEDAMTLFMDVAGARKLASELQRAASRLGRGNALKIGHRKRH